MPALTPYAVPPLDLNQRLANLPLIVSIVLDYRRSLTLTIDMVA